MNPYHCLRIYHKVRKNVWLFQWWLHQMKTLSALLAICAGNSPVTAELWCFSDLCLNKRLSKQSWGWWFETLSRPLWRQCNSNREHRGGYHYEHIYDSRFPKLCHVTSTPPTGDYLSIEIPSWQYRDSQYKDRAASRPRPSYLYNGNSYTWKTVLIITVTS